MNIKSILPFIPGLASRAKLEAKQQVASHETGDREPNGKQERGDGHPQRPLTPEEVAKAVDILKELSGVKASSLNLRVVTKDACFVVLVEGPSGEVVRRLTELDLWHVLKNQEKKTGHILDKAM